MEIDDGETLQCPHLNLPTLPYACAKACKHVYRQLLVLSYAGKSLLPPHYLCCTHLAIKAFLNHQLIAADFKQALGQQSSTGPAPPSKLTTHQMQIVKALIEAHGDDVEVPSQGLFLEAWCLQHPLAASNSLTIPFACDCICL